MANAADPTELTTAAAELYALPLHTFTDARNRRAKGIEDRDLANQVRRLPKPSMAAWLVNMLMARRPAAVEEALALGDTLRRAQETPDRTQLNDLGRQRQRLLAALARDTLAVAAELGHGVSGSVAAEVEQTLRAAMTDADAAAAVSTGRLLRPLTASGWDAVDLDGAVGGPFEPDPAAGGSRVDAGSTRSDTNPQVEEARTALEDAEGAAQGAADDVEDAGRRLDLLQDRRQGLQDEVEELQQRIAGLRGDIRVLNGEVEDAEQARTNAIRAARDAKRDVDRARRQLERLL